MTQTTVDLGKIRFNWRGQWQTNTAYYVNDVVSQFGTSWMCIQDVPANQLIQPGTDGIKVLYWDIMAQGSQPGAIMQDSGDLLVATGSGNLDSVPIGTAGQSLIVNQNADGVEWGASVQTKVKFHQKRWNTAQSCTASGTMLTGSYDTIYPEALDSEFHITWEHMMNHSYGQLAWMLVDFNDGSGWRDISTNLGRSYNYAMYSLAYSTINGSEVLRLTDFAAPPSVLSTGITFGMMAAGHSNGGTSNLSNNYESSYTIIEKWEE